MADKKKDPGMSINGQISINYRWALGKAGERFFTELRDKKRIMGVRCRECQRTLVPPRIFCEECFTDEMDWVEVEPRGTLVTFGESYFSTDGRRLEEPWMVGIVRLDGTDGGLLHFVAEARPEDLEIGMKMEAVFKEKREGNILDIRHFRPLKA